MECFLRVWVKSGIMMVRVGLLILVMKVVEERFLMVEGIVVGEVMVEMRRLMCLSILVLGRIL